MSYLSTYGSKRKFQEGGAMPAPEAAAPAGPEAGGGGNEQEVIALAEAAAQGDQEAATQLGMMLAPLILQEAQAQGGGEAAAPAEAQPVFRKGGKFLKKV